MPRRGPAFFINNLIRADYCTVAALDPTFEIVGFEASQLKTDEPTETARINTLDPVKTVWTATMTRGSNRDIAGITAVNSNLSPWGMYRFTNVAPTWQTLIPTSIISSSNASGSASDVDEAATAIDANFMTATDFNLDWNVRLGGYAAPGATPSNRIFIVVHAALDGTPDLLYPRMLVSIFQSATLVFAAGSRAVTDPDGVLNIFSFSSSLLTDPSGANIRVQVSFEHGDNGSNGKLGTVLVDVESGAPALDSGWIMSPIIDEDPDDNRPPTTSLPFYPSPSWNTDQVFFIVADDQVEHDPDMGESTTGVPINNVFPSKWYDGFAEAGVWFAGEALFVSIGMTVQDRGPKATVVIDEVPALAIGGQNRSGDMFRRRRCRVDITASRDEVETLYRRIVWYKGRVGAFYFSADPDIDLKYQTFRSMWCVLFEISEPDLVLAPTPSSSAVEQGQDLHRLSITVIEKK